MNSKLLQQNIDNTQISTTGIRIILLFSILLEKPCSTTEINEYFINNKALKTKFSEDTIRNDLNVLRNLGCTITKATKSTNYKHILTEHPFTFKINNKTIKSLKEYYNQIYTKISIDDIFKIDNLLIKLSEQTNNEEIKYISKISKLNKDLIKTLHYHATQKHQIIFNYTPRGKKSITINLIAEKVKFRNEKLYIYGFDTTSQKNIFYPIRNITKFVAVNLKSENHKPNVSEATFKYIGNSKHFKLKENEQIIEIKNDGIIVKLTEHNPFILMQNILRMGKNCIVLGPEDFKQKYIQTVKAIREVYKND